MRRGSPGPADRFGLRLDYLGAKVERIDSPAKEVRSKSSRLDQGDRAVDQASDDDARQSGARSKVDTACLGLGLETNKLCRIKHMALPERGNCST